MMVTPCRVDAIEAPPSGNEKAKSSLFFFVLLVKSTARGGGKDPHDVSQVALEDIRAGTESFVCLFSKGIFPFKADFSKVSPHGENFPN